MHDEQDPFVFSRIVNRTSEYLINGPVIFEQTFDLNDGEIYDTYIDPSNGWGKVRHFFLKYKLKKY